MRVLLFSVCLSVSEILQVKAKAQKRSRTCPVRQIYIPSLTSAVDSGVLASIIVSVERPLQLVTRLYSMYVVAEAALTSLRRADLEYLCVLHEHTPAGTM